MIKSDTIRVEDNKLLLVIYYYHQEHEIDEDGRHIGNKEKTYYRCACRIDTRENWHKLADQIMSENPAELFTMDLLGLPDHHTLFADKHSWTRANVARWLKMKTSRKKVHTLEEFVYGRKTKTGKNPGKYVKGAFSTKLPYLRMYTHNGVEYALDNPLVMPVGVWMTATRQPPPRKKPKIVIV